MRLDRKRPMNGRDVHAAMWEILPVIKKSFLWEHVVVKDLHTNMRVHLHGDEWQVSFLISY